MPNHFVFLLFIPAPQPPTHLSVKQGPTNDTVELSWSGPAYGDYSNFSLQWTPPDQLSVTQTHLTSHIVGGMFPGRQYNFTLMTISGGGSKGGPTVRSQPIQRSIRTSRWNLKPEKLLSKMYPNKQFSVSVDSDLFISSFFLFVFSGWLSRSDLQLTL